MAFSYEFVFLCQIRDWAVLVAGDDAYLNEASGYANRGSLRRVLGRNGNGPQPERKERQAQVR